MLRGVKPIKFWKEFRSWLNGERPLEINEAEILSNHHRRATIKVLSDLEDEKIALSDLSHEVAELEHGQKYSRSQRKSIYSSIHSVHLDTLDNADIIDYSTENCLYVTERDYLYELEQYVEERPSEKSLFHEFQDGQGFTANQGFNALSSSRSRFAINFIEENNTSPFKDMYQDLAVDETGKYIEELSSKDWQRQYVGLKQTHVPRLEEMNVLEVNDNFMRISKGENFGHLSKYIPK